MKEGKKSEGREWEERSVATERNAATMGKQIDLSAFKSRSMRGEEGLSQPRSQPYREVWGGGGEEGRGGGGGGGGGIGGENGKRTKNTRKR